METAVLAFWVGLSLGSASPIENPPREIGTGSPAGREAAGAPEAQDPPAEAAQPPGEDVARTQPADAERPTITLPSAVRLALERNFSLLGSADAVSGARWQEKAARAGFFPRLTPYYQRSDETSTLSVDVAQSVPWLGASVTATGRYVTQRSQDAPFPRTTDLRVVVTQPLLRGFGPNASLFELRNARRGRIGQERALVLARQRVAIDVARAFYDVIAYRQLLEVARQSLARMETLLRASQARLEVGMASKLDVFRAELQASQASDSMIRSEALLASALERFRALLALAPGEALEPEEAALPPLAERAEEAPELLVARALERRLELVEMRDSLDDARRAASLARQNLLPQLDLNVGVTQQGVGGSFSDAWSAGDRRVDVFVSASQPLQQANVRTARALAQLQVAGRERGVRQQELEVEQEVRQAVRELTQIRKGVELQQKAVEIAEQQRRLAGLRYERGLANNFDVVDAESSLVTARSALVQLLANWAVARLELDRVVGTLDVDQEFLR